MFILEYKFKIGYDQVKEMPYWVAKKRFKQLEQYQEMKQEALKNLKTKK